MRSSTYTLQWYWCKLLVCGKMHIYAQVQYCHWCRPNYSYLLACLLFQRFQMAHIPHNGNLRGHRKSSQKPSETNKISFTWNPSLSPKRTNLRTSGFNSQTNVYTKHHLKPEVRFFRNPPPSQTNFIRFTGLLRTFAMGPKSCHCIHKCCWDQMLKALPCHKLFCCLSNISCVRHNRLIEQFEMRSRPVGSPQ